jgi:hypothetical protein
MKVVGETEMQLQALMSEELEEEDEPFEEKTHFTMPIIPKEDSDELKNTNPDDLVSSRIPSVGDGSHTWIAAGAEPDAHQFIVTNLFKGVIGWE